MTDFEKNALWVLRWISYELALIAGILFGSNL